jgi:hypothetical protein
METSSYPGVYDSKENNYLPKRTAEQQTTIIITMISLSPQPNNHLLYTSIHSNKTNLLNPQVISGLHHCASFYSLLVETFPGMNH